MALLLLIMVGLGKKEINNFLVGQEKEPKLPPMVLPALLKLLNMANMHPVKVLVFLPCSFHNELLSF